MVGKFFITHVYTIPPLFGFIILFCLGLVSFIRSGKNSVRVSFAALCLLGALVNADVACVSLLPEGKLALTVDRATYFFLVFGPPILLQFIHSFAGIERRRWLEYLAYFFSLFFLFFTPTPLFIKGHRIYAFGKIAQGGPLFFAFVAIVGFTVLYALWVLYVTLHRAKTNTEKNRTKYVLTGVGLIALLIVLNALPVSGIPLYPPGNFSFLPAIFLAFGVLKYDLYDANAVIRTGLIYFLITLALTFIYFITIFFFHRFALIEKGSFVLLPFFLSLFVVFFFHPLRDTVQGLVDTFFYRGHYDYREALKKVSYELSSLIKREEIKDCLTRNLTSILKVKNLYLFLRRRETEAFETSSPGISPPPSSLLHFLEKAATPVSSLELSRALAHDKDCLAYLANLQAALLVPLSSGGNLVGILVIGEKKSGELFVREDLELLSTIANQAVVAFKNAETYEELEKLNRELEVRIAQRTEALRKTIEEKERTEKQLIRSESLAAIGELVAGVAHELNNPLASAYSLIQSSLEKLNTGEVTEEVLDDIKFSLREMKRMGDIIKSLLDLSRKTEDYVEPVVVNTVIEDALRILYNQYKHMRVEIEKEYGLNMPAVEGNFAHLGQVFVNVLKNALQALPNGTGKITIRTRYDRERDRVTVEISDNGKGIPEKYQKDIFKPFFTTKGVGEGTGLGLYICHEIIKRHEGKIEVISEEGKGTTVFIELPCRRNQT